jgi:hypothetical protein
MGEQTITGRRTRRVLSAPEEYVRPRRKRGSAGRLGRLGGVLVVVDPDRTEVRAEPVLELLPRPAGEVACPRERSPRVHPVIAGDRVDRATQGTGSGSGAEARFSSREHILGGAIGLLLARGRRCFDTFLR